MKGRKWVLVLSGGVLAGAIFILFYVRSFQGRSCGGIAANLPQNACPFAYECRSTSRYPDAAGACYFSPSGAFLEVRNRYLK